MPTATQQPLSISVDLSTVKTTPPLIADNTLATVRLSSITEVQRDSGVLVLKWEFHLADDVKTEDGGKLNAGFPLFVNFDLSRDFLLVKMARFVDGLLGTGDKGNRRGKAARPDFNQELVEQLIGRAAVAKIIITKSKSSDYVGNDIASLSFPDDLSPY